MGFKHYKMEGNVGLSALYGPVIPYTLPGLVHCTVVNEFNDVSN
jgi:hypothetical protein